MDWVTGQPTPCLPYRIIIIVQRLQRGCTLCSQDREGSCLRCRSRSWRQDLGRKHSLCLWLPPPLQARPCQTRPWRTQSPRPPCPGQVLMGAASERPDAMAAALPVMGSAERERVIIAFNSADEDLDLDYSCLHELFQAHARRQPSARCLVCQGEALSYAEARVPGPKAASHLPGSSAHGLQLPALPGTGGMRAASRPRAAWRARARCLSTPWCPPPAQEHLALTYALPVHF